MDNRNKNQHYVPQYYFRSFSNDGNSIVMMRRKNGHVAPTSGIVGQSSDDWFYGDAAVEDKMTERDTPYSRNHQDVLGHLNGSLPGAVSPERIRLLIENMLFQRRRTLDFRVSGQGILSFYERFMAPQIADIDNYDSGVSPEATEAVKKALKYVMQALSDPRLTQQATLNDAQRDAAQLFDLKVRFLDNQTALPFIFSDAPVVYANYALRDFEVSKIMETNVGLQVFFPLDSRWAVMLYDAETYDAPEGESGSTVVVSDENDVSELNKLQIHESFQCVYFANADDEPYVKALWASERPAPTKPGKTVEKVTKITGTGQVLGTVNAVVAPEPVFHPNLSFLSLLDLSASRIPYRTAHWIFLGPNAAKLPTLNADIDRRPGSME